MSVESKKKLTGWLILLMIILVGNSLTRIVREITEVRKSSEPYFLQYPQLATTVSIYQWVLFGSACAALSTVWVLYQRVPGTLSIAIRAFVAYILVGMAANWIFVWYPGLPDEFREPLGSAVRHSLGYVAHGLVWYLYLVRSKRVRDIYATQEIPR